MGCKPSSLDVEVVDGSGRDRTANSTDFDQLPGSPNSQDKTMPFFRKQSSEKKRRLQHQLYLARESPDTVFDISGCEISEIPSGTFSLCKVLQKEALIVHNNWLSSLKGGGELKDLETLRILDLHDNEISVLPDDMGRLTYLQVLNLENNKLKALPRTLKDCQCLQTLNLKGNKLKEFPSFLCKMRSLRTLDISKNHITSLPKEFCMVRTLETILLDSSEMHYPPPDICSEGTEAIMKFLSAESGVDYIPPSKVLLDVLDVPKVMSTSLSNQSLQEDLLNLEATVMQYESMQEKKRQERLALERQIVEEQRLQTELAVNAAVHKEHLINYIAEDQARLDYELNALQKQKQAERNNLITTLYEAEHSAENLIQQMLKLNDKAKRTDEIMEKMEKERMEAEEWFIVRQEEQKNIREKDIVANMEKMLAESAQFDAMFKSYLNNRDLTAQRVAEKTQGDSSLLESVLDYKHLQQEDMIQFLLKEEALQKEAFEALQLSKDTKTQRLSNQIELIQQELAQLTAVELDQRQTKQETNQNVLNEKRRSLIALLQQLMDARNLRAEELKKRLEEMEEKRVDDQTDYWLIQFQRLMDRKPQELIDRERQLEYAVIDILERAGANDHIPTFARHRISIETMLSLVEDDLKQMGVHELGLRKNILREIEAYRSREEEERAAEKLKLAEEQKDEGKVVPSAPSRSFSSDLPSPSAPPIDVTARGINSECVVCMNDQSTMLFMNCGHVCCCPRCSDPLKECPLCRGAIVQRILLSLPTS